MEQELRGLVAYYSDMTLGYKEDTISWVGQFFCTGITSPPPHPTTLSATQHRHAGGLEISESAALAVLKIRW
jgi:hypothetical protein